MMSVCTLRDYQEDALSRMHNGCILNGGVGSGKSRTALAYYYTQHGGQIGTSEYVPMKNPRNLYIITTARKRDQLEWDSELTTFYMSTNSSNNYYKNQIIRIDSWNNIQHYVKVENAFFIFDEQRVVGYGAWVKAFLKIASKNKWVLLSATPGDTWLDYLPVFIANGFYKNKTDFINQHVIYNPFVNYPSVQRYVNEGRLIKYKQYILVNMDFQRQTISHHDTIIVNYDVKDYQYVTSNRWNIYENKPIENAGEYCFVLHRIVNSSLDRRLKVMDIVKKHKKAIIFYNYDYELEILRNIFDGVWPYSEWNGHKHQNILTGDHWVYLCQYTSASEAWNCVTTDTIIFYSQNYSYKIMTQAAGRIDRMNTPYKDLYYYHFKSLSKIDSAIYKALSKKKKFNEKGFAPDFSKEEIREPRKPAYEQLSLFDYNNNEPIKQQKSFQSKNFTASVPDFCDEYNNWEDPTNPLYEGEKYDET